MNNEEKILEMLEKHGAMLAEMKAAQNGMQTALAEMNSRLDRMETVQAKQGEQLEELDTRSLRSAVLLETEVSRDIRLVYEGHAAIMEKLDTLTPKSRTEALEDDVAMLKDVVKLMRQEINELKKAQ